MIFNVVDNKKNLDNYYIVGQVDANLADFVNFKYTGTIFAAPGVIKHIKKRHSHELNKRFLDDLISTIKVIIESPDYIGSHPKKKGTGIEFIKKLDTNFLVGVEVDLDDNYIYVATMYPIVQAKIDSRLNSGRLKKYSNLEGNDDVALTE